MDGVTERKLTALILEEAARLKKQAEEDGVHAYLHPKKRYRPNSRFLQTAVLGVERANRASQVSEMWKLRDQELGITKNSEKGEKSVKISTSELRKPPVESHTGKHESSHETFSNNSKEEAESSSEANSEEDFELEKFLQSKRKRGRGAIGARMDIAGPYPDDDYLVDRVREKWEETVKSPASKASEIEGKWKRGVEETDFKVVPNAGFKSGQQIGPLEDEIKNELKKKKHKKSSKEKKDRKEKRSKNSEKRKKGKKEKRKKKGKEKKSKRS